MNADIQSTTPQTPAPKKSRRWLWIAIPAALLVICVLVAAAGAFFYINSFRNEKAQPWGPQYSTPGTSLTMTEVGRGNTPQNGTGITYSLVATGLAANQSYALSFRSFPDEPPVARGDYRVDAAGKLIHADTGQPLGDITMGQYAKGQPIYVALMSADKATQVFAKVVPFPIEASDGHSCRLLVELLSRSGTTFEIAGQGFQPNEIVQIEDRSETETMNLTQTADANGTIDVTELPAVIGKQSGMASYHAIGRNCNVQVQYQWGPAALQIQ